MLEFNLYDNFNPNKASDFRVKARGVTMNYELWQTGYKYTSTAILSIKAEIGDIVEILINDSFTIATSSSTNEVLFLNLVYIVTEIDAENKATLKNYFWAMIDGLDIPTSVLSGSSLSVLNLLVNKKTVSLISDGIIVNSGELSQQIKYNRKSDSDTAEKIAKDMFRVIKRQPFIVIRNNEVKTVLASRDWTRRTISTKIDEVQNPSIESETLIQRSNYNLLNAYIKSNDAYPSYPKTYTIDDANNVVDLENYKGDGTDLPKQRIIKTSFFDEVPTLPEIKALITKDSTIVNIFFNQINLSPLVVNDLVDMYYKGELFNGYIADRAFFESDGGLRIERLLFIEGG